MERKKSRKGIVLGIIILFVGVGIIPSTIGINETKFMNLGSRGYIQRLINNASNGDTIYIPAGTYYENIYIYKSISLIGEDKNTTIIDGRNLWDVVSIHTDRVNISGFTIQNGGTEWKSGIESGGNYCTFSDNTISNNYYGIRITEMNNTIQNNIISSNTMVGVKLSSSQGNIIKGNIINSNNMGIFMDRSPSNTVVNNSITSNGCGVGISNSDNNNIIGNNISNNIAGITIIYSKWNSKWNTITANNISHNDRGIGLGGASRTIIANNLVSHNGNGIHLTVGYDDFGSPHNSGDNVIMKNTFLGNSRSASFKHKLPVPDGGYNNTWRQNYWNGPRIVPKLVFGITGFFPWIVIDWRPSLKPYDIEVLG